MYVLQVRPLFPTRINSPGFPEDADSNKTTSERDSGVSVASGSSPTRVGIYHLVAAMDDEQLIVDDEEDDGLDASIEIEEGDSVFDSDQECSSLSVSDSEDEQSPRSTFPQPAGSVRETSTTDNEVYISKLKNKVQLSFIKSNEDSSTIYDKVNGNNYILCELETIRTEDIHLESNGKTGIFSTNQDEQGFSTNYNQSEKFVPEAKVDAFCTQVDCFEAILSGNLSQVTFATSETMKECSRQPLVCVNINDANINKHAAGITAVIAGSISPVFAGSISPVIAGSSSPKIPSLLQRDQPLESRMAKDRLLFPLPKARNPPLSAIVTPYVIEGRSLNRGWVDRVNKAITASAQNAPIKSSNDLIKHATGCKIMKSHSEKQLRIANKAVDQLRKRSRSDVRHDRPREVEMVQLLSEVAKELESARVALGIKRLHQACSEQNSNLFVDFSAKTSTTTTNQKHIGLDVSTNSNTLEHLTSNQLLQATQQPFPKKEILTPVSLLWQNADSPNHWSASVQRVDLTSCGQFCPANHTHDDLNIPSNDSDYSARAALTESKPVVGLLKGNRKPVDVSDGKKAYSISHRFTRKPAMRRKGFTWTSQGGLRHSSSTCNRQERDTLSRGSSLDLAPSLLNLYDHTIASGTRHIDKKGDRLPTKTMSLPTRTPESATAEAATTQIDESSSRLLPPKQQADRPLSLMDTEQIGPRGVAVVDDNKKRPLSISSASSTSLTSSPRLRKKRQSAFNGWDVGVVQENCQDSQITLVPRCDSDPRVLEAFELRTRVDSGSADGCKSGDGFFDSMSVTSSENGSFKDEVDNSGKDYAALLPLHSDRLNISSAKSGISNGSHIQSHSLNASKISSIIEASVHSPLSSTPKKPIKSIKSTDHQFNGSLLSESSSPDGNLSQIEYDTIYSPNHSGRSSGSAPRHDARMKFFSNYEDSILHSTSLQAPIAEEDFDISPSPQGRSPKDSSSFSNSSSEAASSTTPTKTTRAKDSPSLHSSREKAAATYVTSAAPKSDHRRDRSSQLSPSSDKTIRRADRGGSASSHDSQSASPRSGLARTSKKRDHLIMPDTGSRSSPVYASYVSKVVTEIIESERTYIASLENIIHGYLEPMERVLDSSDAKKDVACLFSNIRDIYKFGCMFLNDLEMAGADPVKVAQCFVKYNKGFVIYTDYCTNYPRAVEVLTRFMQHPDLSQLCKERQLALGHGLPLGAYLLKPVQRILKYHLLLHNIVKNCEKEKEEAAILEQAFLHMTHMAHHINEMKRKHEHAVRIQEIQSQLEDYVGEDLTRLGELVLEGSFKVSGAKASRQVFLFERGILISKIKEGGMLSCKTFIRCSNLMLVEVIPNEPLSFHIIPFDNPRAQDTLQARNMEQKLRWCHDIKKQILESFKGIPDNAKNLIMQLGRDHDDDYISKEVLDAGKRNQHTAPEYLEKRRFRRKSTSRLPDFRLLKPQKSKKGSNKKNESKSEEKISTGIIRRSESKSPERHGHIHSKQNFMTKRRSHSTSSSTVSLSSLPSSHLNDQSSADINNAISWPITKHLGHSSPKSPDSPVYRKSPSKFTYSKEEAQIEAEISKRPASFLMARANPVLLEDITLLLARCGGPRKLPSPPLLEDDKENKLSSLTDCPDLGGLNFRTKEPAGKSGQVKKKSQYTKSLVSVEEISSLNSSQNATMVSETEVSPHKSSLNQNVAETRRSDPKSMSLPDLYKAGDLKEVFGKFEEVIMDPDNIRRKTVPPKTKNDMNEINNFSKSRSHMSRKDIEYALQNFRRRMEDKGNKTARQNRESETGNRNNQSANENVLLKKTGLRLPNTSQLLAAKKCGPNPRTNEGSEKLINSEEKLTRRSVDSLSHLNKDLWASGSLNACSRSSMETESLNSSRHSLSIKRRPYNDYDTTESMQVSNSRDTIDLLHRNSVSTLQYSNSDAKENSQRRAKLSSQIHYATPPRSYMTLENMRKLGSVKDSDKPYFHFQDIRGSSLKNASSGTMKAFAISPVTVTVAKPVSFNTTNLLRSNSTPITSERHAIAAKTTFKGRPVSMDVDTLTEESNRLLAEMEEYISSSYENMSSTNKFPTSLPAIPVEEELGSKRLSVVSSISTSSYESQDSNSSDGLIRTLKSKLRAWERLRNDSEYSYASSFTSDDEDHEEATHSESSSALELQIKTKIPWKANTESENLESSQNDLECPQRDLECSKNDFESSQTDLEYSQNDLECSQKDLEYSQNDLEYSQNELECPEIGSFLTNQLTHLPMEQAISHYHADFTDNELHLHGKYYFDSIEMSSETSKKFSVPDDQLEQTPSNSPTPETVQALRSQSTDNVDNENSHSNYLPKYSSIKIMSLLPLTNEVVLQPEADLLLDESPEITDPVKVSFLNTVLGKETLDLRKDDSCELFNSNSSCHEREMSPASDSEISKDETENYEENEEGQLPRKSIREFVQVFEKKQREQSQRTLEIRRKEPSVLIRQRLETLRESVLHGWRSSSSSSSRPASEERDFVPEKSPQLTHCMVEQLPFTFDNNNQNDTCIRSICAKILKNRDSMSKSVENLSKSGESVYLSRSREGLNAISDTSGNRHSVPSFSLKSNNAGHEKDAMRFHYKSSPTNLTSSGNQFIHKPHASLEPSVPLYESTTSLVTEFAPMQSTASMATEFAPMQASRSMCQLDGLDADDDSLVVMKGWVRALISKFQENE